MRRKCFGVAVAASFSSVLMVTVLACGNDANDVAVCQELEFARCDRAEECGLDLSYPLHTGSTAVDNAKACQLFYEDACLHGLVTPEVPDGGQVSHCLEAIKNGNCNAVINPQDNPECAWLNPPDASADAGTADVAATVDVPVVVTVPDATVISDAAIDSSLMECYDACDSTCATGDSPCLDTCFATCQGM